MHANYQRETIDVRSMRVLRVCRGRVFWKLQLKSTVERGYGKT